MGCQVLEDVRNLTRCFPLSENHLGHALAEGAVMVDLGESEILKGQVPEALNGFVG
jgi:hypothetical protein